MKRLTLVAGLSILASVGAAQAEVSYFTGWEDNSSPAILGYYGNMYGYGFETSDPYAGEFSLGMMEDPVDGTPQGYVAFITGLEAGDTVTVGGYMKGMDDGSGTNGRGRFWHHYADATDINSYAGGGNGGSDTAYIGEGGEWGYGETTFTFTGAEGAGMVIEARLYSYNTNNFLQVDNMTVTVSRDSANVELAGVPAPGALALLGLGGLVARRRRA